MKGLVETIWRPIFSIWCWIATYAWMVVGCLVFWPAFLFLPQGFVHRWFTVPLLGGCIPLCFNRTTVTFHPEGDKGRRGIYIQNHVSVLDGSMATWTIPHEFTGMFNNWHFLIPGYGWIMKFAHGIGVPSKKEGRSKILGDQVRDRVENHNISVLAFPEGHRTLDGKVREFRRGVFFMARDAGVPVIPMCVRGMWEVQNKTHHAFYAGHLEVYFGRPIETRGLSDEQVADLARHCRLIHQTWIEKGEMPQLEGFEEPPRALRAVAA